MHPNVDKGAGKIDFRALRDGKPLFYLEATLAAQSDEEKANKARENQVYEALNGVNSPNFFIGVEVQGAPTSPPPARKMKRFLERQLASLDPDEVANQYSQGGGRAVPSWLWEHDGWQIRFFPIAKSKSARGKTGVRSLGVKMRGMAEVFSHIKIRESIRDKASRYGGVDLPYIVAINVIDDFIVDDIDISNALFGEEQVTYKLHKDGRVKPYPGRQPNGAWYGRNGPQNQRVSAALIAVNLKPPTIARETPVLWHNPWALSPLSLDMWHLAQLNPDFKNNRLVKRDGKSGWQLLGLDPDWPTSRE